MEWNHTEHLPGEISAAAAVASVSNTLTPRSQELVIEAHCIPTSANKRTLRTKRFKRRCFEPTHPDFHARIYYLPFAYHVARVDEAIGSPASMAVSNHLPQTFTQHGG